MSNSDPLPQLPFRNFNVQYDDNPQKAFTWAETKNVPLKIFTNFDGGGFNFYICEFLTLEDAKQFQIDFSITGDNMFWAEDAEGEIHYIVL